jgi:hypothetical protein
MLFHLSFNAQNPPLVADALAQILDADVIDAPSPPFNKGALFICCGDDRGTMISLEPSGVVYEPGFNEMTAMPRVDVVPERNAFHGLFMAAVPEARVLEIAAEHGWPARRVNQGPFEVINVWIEGRQLIEFTTPELYPAYKATFDTDGVKTLDASLRIQEERLAEMLASKA